ncbi:MAG: hypothetical protein OIF57_10500 [Marinobacterium sp.]|nr:hypothetical protein [Marinobacterium sp.]
MMQRVEQRLIDAAIPGLTVRQQTDHQASECISDELPLVLLVIGKHKYQPPETTGNDQQRLKTFGLTLVARAAEVDAVEDEIISCLIGWQIDSWHLPVQMVESDTVGIKGDLYERQLIFGIGSVLSPRT